MTSRMIRLMHGRRIASRGKRIRALAVAAATTLVLGGCDGGDTAGGERDDTSAVQESSRSDTSTNLGAYIVDLNTGEKSSLPEPLQGGDSYQVSPDGTMLAYTLRTSPYDGFVADVDGTGMRVIHTPHNLEALAPSWSPDGSLLVYQGRREQFEGQVAPGYDLYVVDVTTGQITQRLIREASLSSWDYMNPSFTPDGGSILFQKLDGSHSHPYWDLWSIPITGGDPTMVRRDAAFGAYSPDGETLAYLDAPDCCSEGWTSGLWLVGADGSDPRPLVDALVSWLRWSPDGTRIAYVTDSEVGVVDVATGMTSRVAEGGTVEWLDEHSLVVGPG